MMNYYCPDCNRFELREGALFCSVCGKLLTELPIKNLCANCASEVSDTDHFCIKCGHKLN
jgi:predicted amidophosphoribosyltransferase